MRKVVKGYTQRPDRKGTESLTKAISLGSHVKVTLKDPIERGLKGFYRVYGKNEERQALHSKTR